MPDETLNRFEEAADPRYMWEYRDHDRHVAEYVLISHELEKKIVVGPDDNTIKLYDTSHPTGVTERDWTATERGESAKEWIEQRINYRK